MAATQLFSSARLDRTALAAAREPARAGSAQAAERETVFSLDGADPGVASAAGSNAAPTKAEPPQTAVAPSRENRPADRAGLRALTLAWTSPIPADPAGTPEPEGPSAAEMAEGASPSARPLIGETSARVEEDETRDAASEQAPPAEAPIATPIVTPRLMPAPLPTGTPEVAPASVASDRANASAPGRTEPVAAIDAQTESGQAAGSGPVAPAGAGPQAPGGLGIAQAALAAAAMLPAQTAPGGGREAPAAPEPAALERVGLDSATVGAGSAPGIESAGARRQSAPAATPTPTPQPVARAPSPFSDQVQAFEAAGSALQNETDAEAEPAAEPVAVASAAKESVGAPERPASVTAAAPPALPPTAPSPSVPPPPFLAAEPARSGATGTSVAEAGDAASATSATAATATATAGFAAPPVPLGAVPMTIALRALQDAKRFEIRLDPVELGRIDVRLDIDREDGSVRADLVVDRPATLALLQRDAGVLQDALSQAGLDASAGINLSLRDGSPQGQTGQSQGQGQGQGQAGRGEPGRPNDTARRAERTASEGPAPIRLRPIGIDIRI